MIRHPSVRDKGGGLPVSIEGHAVRTFHGGLPEQRCITAVIRVCLSTQYQAQGQPVLVQHAMKLNWAFQRLNPTLTHTGEHTLLLQAIGRVGCGLPGKDSGDGEECACGRGLGNAEIDTMLPQHGCSCGELRGGTGAAVGNVCALAQGSAAAAHPSIP